MSSVCDRQPLSAHLIWQSSLLSSRSSAKHFPHNQPDDAWCWWWDITELPTTTILALPIAVVSTFFYFVVLSSPSHWTTLVALTLSRANMCDHICMFKQPLCVRLSFLFYVCFSSDFVWIFSKMSREQSRVQLGEKLKNREKKISFASGLATYTPYVHISIRCMISQWVDFVSSNIICSRCCVLSALRLFHNHKALSRRLVKKLRSERKKVVGKKEAAVRFRVVKGSREGRKETKSRRGTTRWWACEWGKMCIFTSLCALFFGQSICRARIR